MLSPNCSTSSTKCQPNSHEAWLTDGGQLTCVCQIMETEKEKTLCEAEHQTKAAEYTSIQQRLAYLLNDIPRTINRAKYQALFVCHTLCPPKTLPPFCSE